MTKVKPIERLDLAKSESVNLEAISLAYIYVVVLILFFYDNHQSTELQPPVIESSSHDQQEDDDDDDGSFVFDKWRLQMQDSLSNIKKSLFGWY
jgi:hypothetical protein